MIYLKITPSFNIVYTCLLSLSRECIGSGAGSGLLRVFYHCDSAMSTGASLHRDWETVVHRNISLACLAH